MTSPSRAAKKGPVPGEEPCPCGRPLTYGWCCRRYHAGPLHLLAPDPESLMRSRYTAFVKDVSAYLINTWHPDTSPEFIEPPEPGLQWLGLTIKSVKMTGRDAGEVSFVARCKIGGRAQRLEETSRFVREHGQWFYLDALPSEPPV